MSLNVNFVPDNSKAEELAAKSDTHAEYSRRVAELCAEARTLPLYSAARQAIMSDAMKLAEWNDRTNR